MEIEDALKDKREEILRIAASHGAQSVRIFGSLARGEAGPDSDIDILVKLNLGRSLLDIVAIKQDLEDLLGCKVDVVTEAAISPYIREQVLKEAVAL
jgi:predicted nucleotidyltransferase